LSRPAENVERDVTAAADKEIEASQIILTIGKQLRRASPFFQGISMAKLLCALGHCGAKFRN
jgi:hypothetical protein